MGLFRFKTADSQATAKMVHLFHRSRNHPKEPDPKHALEPTLTPVPEKPVQEDSDSASSPERLIHDAARRSNPGNPGTPMLANMPGSMPASEEQFMGFPEPEVSALSLDGKHGAKIRYTYYPAAPASSLGHNNRFSQTLIVFLNGLMLPRSSWDASINVFLEKRTKAGLPYPALLSYDRYGQGDSDRDPGDVDPPPCHGHDIMSAVRDLRQFTLQIWKEHLQRSSPTQSPCLVFVCNPDVPNMEGLSRRNLATLLPDSDGPRLEGWGGSGPYLTVVGHDWETFAEQSCKWFSRFGIV